MAEFYGLTKASTAAPILSDNKKFIQNIANSLKGQNLNILASVTIAQAILESNWVSLPLQLKQIIYFELKHLKTGAVKSLI